MRNKLRSVIYILGLFFTVQVAMSAYVNSSYLSQFISERALGIIYTASSLLAIFYLTFAPRVLRKFGNYKVLLLLSSLNLFTLLGITFVKNIEIVIPLFIVYLAVGTATFLNLDILLEKQSEDCNTGNIRGFYLSISNIAWVVSPFIAGLFLSKGYYWGVYLLSALMTIPFLFLVRKNFKDFKDPNYFDTPFWKTLKKIYHLKDVYNILAVRCLLHLFYSWMIIYSPIYLSKYIGLDWKSIGFIFTIMLIPFVIFQVPFGILADKKYGEKEILSLGLILMGVSTISLSFITSQEFWIWATLLFVTRIGASAVEIMSETYFFKKVDEKDADIIGFFRMTLPFAYIIAPTLATITILIFSFKSIFIVLGLLMFLGLKYSLTIKDTK